MWSSDYPHTLASREVIARDFRGVPEEVKTRMVRGNAEKLYGLLSEATE
jgi:predicted TIM-barrel fold metal-dependent hydrolase